MENKDRSTGNLADWVKKAKEKEALNEDEIDEAETLPEGEVMQQGEKEGLVLDDKRETNKGEEIEDAPIIPVGDESTPDKGHKENPPPDYINNIINGEVPRIGNTEPKQDNLGDKGCEIDEADTLPEDEADQQEKLEDEIEEAPTIPESNEPAHSGGGEPPPDIVNNQESSVWPPIVKPGGEEGNIPVDIGIKGKGNEQWPRNMSLPKVVYAHFLLIDIDAPVKEIRGIPRYLQIEKTRTLIGRYKKAHIYLDDPNTVLPKHAKVIYEQKDKRNKFVIYPVDAGVYVNGKMIDSEGIVLKNGDMIEIGSARLIFFTKDLKEEVNYENRS